MPAAFLVCAVLLLTACGGAVGPSPEVRRQEPAVTAPHLFALSQPQGRVTRITYLLPGALSTSALFGPLRKAETPGHLVMEYRFPGMQGQPLTPPMRIQSVAAEIAVHAARYPKARLEILAFSTGSAIALEAAGRIGPQRGLHVVVLSGATPFPGAYVSALRGGWALARAALRIGSLETRAVWTEYYKTLLYGYGWHNRPDLRKKAEALAKRDKRRLVLPKRGLGRAQTQDLLGWRLSEAARRSSAKILFLHGAADPVFAPRREAQLAAAVGGRLCLVKEGGHLLLTTHPNLVSAIRAYLADQWQAEDCR